MGSRKTTQNGLLRHFASTFREWHYLVGGFAFGFLAGIEYYRRHVDD